ncbi:MAG: hypothetical protein R3B13_29450 [Polyangiaceae bacterium]
MHRGLKRLSLWTVLAVVACGAQRPAPEPAFPTPTPPPGAATKQQLRPSPAPAEPARSASPLALSIVTNPLANTFYWIDQASNGGAAKQTLESARPLAPMDRRALERFAELQRTLGADTKGGSSAAAPMLDALPTLSARERFAAAFAIAANLEAALAQLSLAPAQTATVREVFTRIGPRIARLPGDADRRETAVAKLTGAAEGTRLRLFLGRMADFYGVRDKLAQGLSLVVVSSPEGPWQPVPAGSALLFPVNPRSSAAPPERWLRAAIPPLAGFMETLLPPDLRRSATRGIPGSLGLPNLGQPRLFDAATRLALADLFSQGVNPWSDELGTPVADFAPGEDYPYAIDSYARALQADLAKMSSIPGAYAGPYLKVAAQRHGELFPVIVRHHTRVASLLSGGDATTALFSGLFAARERFLIQGDDVATFMAATRESNAPRFLVAGADYVARHRRALVPFDPTLGAVLGALTPSRSSACIGSRFDLERGAWDFVIVGNGPALKRLLIAIHRGMPIPRGKPQCT